jgi:hypothetical protein
LIQPLPQTYKNISINIAIVQKSQSACPMMEGNPLRGKEMAEEKFIVMN